MQNEQQQAAATDAEMEQAALYHQSLMANHSPEQVAAIIGRIIGPDNPTGPLKIADLSLAAAGILCVCMTALPEAERKPFMGGIARHIAILDQQQKQQRAAAPAPDATVIRAAPPAYPMQGDATVVPAGAHGQPTPD